MYRISNSRRERYTELMAQVDRLKLHSTKFGQCRLVTATQLKISASGEKKNVVSEVSEGEVSDTTSQRRNSKNLVEGISCPYIVPETET